MREVLASSPVRRELGHPGGVEASGSNLDSRSFWRGSRRCERAVCTEHVLLASACQQIVDNQGVAVGEPQFFHRVLIGIAQLKRSVCILATIADPAIVLNDHSDERPMAW